MAVTRYGLTWWGQRWIAALEDLGALYANRLPRGRTYARRGAVTELSVAAGTVTARVKGSRARPYRVTLGLPVFHDDTWQVVVAALADQVRHAAALLDGQMPPDVDDVLAACGVSLFPRAGELDTNCSCPDWANPCKHVAAVHYVLAETFDADPFLLPALRGRDRDRLLAALRAARAGGEVVEDAPPQAGAVPLTSLSAATLWDSPGDLAGIAVHPQPPLDPVGILRSLGTPPGCRLADVSELEQLLVTATRTAWRLAAGDDYDISDPMLTELRARGSASTRELADALGLRDVDVREALRRLVDAGVVRRTGHARGTRYQA